jgi:hypothetical protein
MHVIFVVDRQLDWPFVLPSSSVTTAREYLTDAQHRRARA